MNELDPLTGLTEEDYARLGAKAEAEWRANPNAGEEIEVEISPEVRSVVSVRFNRGELGPVEQAAIEAGLKLSAFIRMAAMNAAARESNVVDLDRVRRDLAQMRELSTDALRAMGLTVAVLMPRATEPSEGRPNG